MSQKSPLEEYKRSGISSAHRSHEALPERIFWRYRRIDPRQVRHD